MSKNHLKLFGLPVLLILVLVGLFNLGCEDEPEQTEVNQDQSDALCDGNYEITSVSTSDFYYCDPWGFFDIEYEANIDKCFQGLTLQWVELWSESEVAYRSNPIGFYPSGGNKETYLKFGGSIPSGQYDVVGRMIDLQTQCTNGICRDETKSSHQIEVIQCPTEKHLYIEYNFQYDSIWQKSYDLRVSPKLSEYMSIAFNAAGATHELDEFPNDTAEFVCNIDDSVAAYIWRAKVTLDYFLCGIIGFVDTTGVQLDWLLGKAYYNNITFEPTVNTGSLVSGTACELYAGGIYGYTNEDVLIYTTIHELGHQCGVKNHCDNCQFCVMNLYPDDYPDVTRLWNPHFCEDCIDLIRDVPEW